MRIPRPRIGVWPFLKALYQEWNDDQLSDIAAALTFYSVLALFPFLIFLVSLASLVIDPRMAESLIQDLRQVAPPQVVEIVGERLHALAAGDRAGLLTLSAIAAIWAASGGVAALMRMLNQAYDVTEGRPWWKVRFIAIAMTLGGAVLSIVAALLAVAAPAIAGEFPAPVPVLITWLRLPAAGLVLMLVMALLYYFLPDVEQEFRFVTPGSVVATLLWLGASWGFSIYVQRFGEYEVTYGALGGIVVLLVWMWISSQVLLLGAEINALWEHTADEGKAPGEKRPGERQAPAAAGARQPAAALEAPDRAAPAPAARPARQPPRLGPRAPGILTGMLVVLSLLLFRRARPL